MDDLISRQAAIEALNKMKIYRPLDSDRYVISDCLNKIVNLPSAQKAEYERIDGISVMQRGDRMEHEIDRIECAIRHIESSVDIDPWACEIAVNAMRELIKRDKNECNKRESIE